MFQLTVPVVLSALASTALAAPYVPKGGLGTNSTPPVYNPMSDFDVQSLVSNIFCTQVCFGTDHSAQSLALYQEWIELDLFHYGLAKFSTEEFDAANITADDRYLLQFMADQEVGHANLITNILGRELLCLMPSGSCAHVVYRRQRTAHRSSAITPILSRPFATSSTSHRRRVHRPLSFLLHVDIIR